MLDQSPKPLFDGDEIELIFISIVYQSIQYNINRDRGNKTLEKPPKMESEQMDDHEEVEMFLIPHFTLVGAVGS